MKRLHQVEVTWMVMALWLGPLTCDAQHHPPLYFETADLVDSFDQNGLLVDSVLMKHRIERAEALNMAYTRNLIELQEPRLLNATGADEIYRLTLLRPSENPIALRVERTEENILVHAKEQHMIEENRFFIDYEQIKLTENDWKTLAHQIDQLEFFNLKSTLPGSRIDHQTNTIWILEGCKSNQYHMAQRMHDQASDLRATLKTLSSLAEMEIGFGGR